MPNISPELTVELTRYNAMLRAWLTYNGTRRITEPALQRLARSFPVSRAATLDRMLRERGIVIE